MDTVNQNLCVNEKQKFIDKLFSTNSRYSSPSIAMSFANVLDAISKDIYNDPTRFFFELLQNADDASLGSSMLDMYVNSFDNEWIIFSYNGKPFTERDVIAICSSGDSNKAFDNKKTGAKGIGFKSIFKLTDSLILSTGGFSFSFSKDYWVDETIWQPDWGSYAEFAEMRKSEGYKPPYLRIPWHIIPIWTDITSASYYSLIKDYSVNIIFKPKLKTKEVITMIADVLSKAVNVIFLRCSNVEIKLFDNSKPVKEIYKQTGEQTVKIWDDSNCMKNFIIKSSEVNLRDYLDEDTFNSMIRDNEDIPEKVKRSQLFNIGFAGEIKNDELCVTEKPSRLLYSFLPTKANYNFPFLLNANFILDAGRTNIHENNFLNMFILQKSPMFLFQWMKELSSLPGNSTRLLNLIPNKINIPDNMAGEFQVSLKKEIECNEFLLNYNNVFKRPSELLMDEAEMIWSGRLNILDQGLFFGFLSKVFGMKVELGSFINPLIEEQRDKEYSLSVYDIGVRKFDFLLLLEYMKYLCEINLNEESVLYENLNLLCLFNSLFHGLTGAKKISFLSAINKGKFIFNDKMQLTYRQDLVIPNDSLSYMELQERQSPIHPGIFNALKNDKYPNLRTFLIRDLNIHVISDDEMLDFLSRNLTSEKLISKFNIKSGDAYEFIFKRSKAVPDFKYEKFSGCMLMNSHSKLCRKENLYISEPYTDEFSQIHKHVEDMAINKAYMGIIEMDEVAKENHNESLVSLINFFTKMRCKMPLEILENKIDAFLTRENSIDVVLWIAERWNEKKYTNNQIKMVEYCKFLNSRKSFDFIHNLYFPDNYSPDNLQFQAMHVNELFLSEIYFQSSSLPKDTLMPFFQILGVKPQNQMLLDCLNTLNYLSNASLQNSLLIFQSLIDLYNEGKIKPSDYDKLSNIQLYNNQGDATQPVNSLFVFELDEKPKRLAIASFCYPSMFLNSHYVTNKTSLDFLKTIKVKTSHELAKYFPNLLNNKKIKDFKECLLYLFSLYRDNINLFQGHFKKLHFDNFYFHTSTGFIQRSDYQNIYLSNKFSKTGKGIEFVVTEVSYISYESYFEDDHYIPNFKKFLKHIGILSQRELIPKLRVHLTNYNSSFNVFLWLLKKHLKTSNKLPSDLFQITACFYDQYNKYQSVKAKLYLPDDISPIVKFQKLLPSFLFLNYDYYKDVYSESNANKISDFYKQFGVSPQGDIINDFGMLMKLESYDAIVLKFADLYKQRQLPTDLLQKMGTEGLWLLSQGGHTMKSKELYFSSAYTHQEFANLEQIIQLPHLFISNFYLEQGHQSIVEFLKFLGVQPQTALLIRSPKYMDASNSIPLMRLAFEKLNGSLVRKDFFNNIKKENAKCLTQNGKCLPIGSLYLGFAFDPQLDFEMCIFSDIFLSQNYIDPSYSKSQVAGFRKFLIEMGALPSLSFVQNISYLTEQNAPAYFNLIFNHPDFDQKLFVEKFKNIRGLTLQGNYVKFENLYFSDQFYDKSKDFPINQCIEQDILLSDAFISPNDTGYIIYQKKRVLKLIRVKEKYEIVSLIPKLLYQYNSIDLIRFLLFIYDQKESHPQNKQNIELVLQILNDANIKLLSMKKSYLPSSQLYMQDIFTPNDYTSSSVMMLPSGENSPTLDMFIHKDIFLSPEYYSSLNKTSLKNAFESISFLKVKKELDLLCDIKQHITPDNAIQLLTFITDYSPRDVLDTFIENMKNDTIQFPVLTQDNCMVDANKLFLCDLSSKYHFEKCIQNNNLFVNEGYFKNLKRPKMMEMFLSEIGVKDQECLLDEIETIINKSNSEAIALQMFDLFLKNSAAIKPYIGQLSKTLLFRTQQCDYKLPCEMYLNDVYSPALPIEKFAKRDIFLNDCFNSHEIVRNNCDMWVHFLKELGFSEEPKIVSYSYQKLSVRELLDASSGSIAQSHLIKEYLQKIANDLLFTNETFKSMLEMNIKVNISNIYSIDCLDYAINNYDFSVLFWSHLMQNWQNYRTCLKEVLITDHTGKFFKAGLMPFMVYMARTYPILPTTAMECLPSVAIVNLRSMELRYDLENILTYLSIRMEPDFLKAVNMKDRLERNDLIRVLHGLPKIDIRDHSRCIRIISLCYRELMRNEDHSDLEDHTFFLLSQNYEFKKASDLYFLDPSLKESAILNENFQTILIPLDLMHYQNIYSLLRTMKVQIIDKSSLQISFAEVYQANWIMQKLIGKFMYITALALKLSHSIINKEKLKEIVSIYKETFGQLKFFTAKNLCFTYQNQNAAVLLPYTCSERISETVFKVYVTNDETEDDFPSSLFLEAFSIEIATIFELDQLSSLDFIILLAEKKPERMENILIKKGIPKDMLGLIKIYWENE